MREVPLDCLEMWANLDPLDLLDAADNAVLRALPDL